MEFEGPIAAKMELGDFMMLENNQEICDCPKKKCARHAKCGECLEYHKNHKLVPYCRRPKKGLFFFKSKK